MGSRKRLVKFGKSHHKFLLALEAKQKRTAEVKKIRKQQKKDDLSLASALSTVQVGTDVNAPKVGAPLPSKKGKSESDVKMVESKVGGPRSTISKRNRTYKKRRERQAKIAARALQRMHEKGIAMSE